MFKDEPAPLYPLLGFTAAVVEGAVAIRLKFATTPRQYSTHLGEAQQFVMSPDTAIKIGRALIERGELARGASPA